MLPTLTIPGSSTSTARVIQQLAATATTTPPVGRSSETTPAVPRSRANGAWSGIPGSITVHASRSESAGPPTAAQHVVGIEPTRPLEDRLSQADRRQVQLDRRALDQRSAQRGRAVRQRHDAAAEHVPAGSPGAMDGDLWRWVHNRRPAAAKIFVNCASGFSAANPRRPSRTRRRHLQRPSVGRERRGRLPQRPSDHRWRDDRRRVGGRRRRQAGGQRACVHRPPDPSRLALGREGPGWAQTTELVIFGGRRSGGARGCPDVTGGGALCQTFVYLAGPKDPHDVRRATDHERNLRLVVHRLEALRADDRQSDLERSPVRRGDAPVVGTEPAHGPTHAGKCRVRRPGSLG